MVESQDSLYDGAMDTQSQWDFWLDRLSCSWINSIFVIFREYNLEGISTGDLVFTEPNSQEILCVESILRLSPDTYQQALHNASPSEVNNMDQFINMPHEQQFYEDQMIIPDLAHFYQLPSIEPLENAWAFNIELNSETASQASWMFSQKLNKVFVKIDKDLNVYVNFNVVDPLEELFIRAMIVYTSPNDLAEPVKKCPNHRSRANPYHAHPEHILTCSVQGTSYIGSETGKLFGDKLACLIPLNAIVQNEPLKFQFSCQNSCSGGMNRKMTSVIFTLENKRCEILGRKALSFKVCSCPKRDKGKDEDAMGTKALPKKRKLENVASTSKKVAKTVALPALPVIVKQETDSTISMNSDPIMAAMQVDAGQVETKNFIIPAIALPSVELKQKVLNAIYDVVAGEAARTNDVATYQPYLMDIQQKMGK